MSKTLLKAQVLRHLAKANKLTMKQTEAFFESLFLLTVKEVGEKKQFTIPGIGIIKLIKTKPRTGRNPRTGERIRIPSGKKIKIKFLKTFRDNRGRGCGQKAGQKGVQESVYKAGKRKSSGTI